MQVTVPAKVTEQAALRDALAPRRLTSVVDVGANPIDGDPPYAAMFQAGWCTVTGFEPQPAALAALDAAKGARETYLPHVVGDGDDHVLHVTVASGMTSLFRPDRRRLALFNGFTEWGVVKEEVPISTTRLDDIEDLPDVDYLKIDVQGAELMVFQGGREKLKSAVAIQTEVSFIPLYEDQPTFSDVDAELRAQGFVPHAFAAVKQWAIAPTIIGGDFRRPINQLLEADIVYVRDFGAAEDMTSEQLRHLCLVADLVYRSPDLALRCLLELAARDEVDAPAVTAYTQSVRV